jgi:hypothetical protein
MAERRCHSVTGGDRRTPAATKLEQALTLPPPKAIEMR